MAEPVEKHSFVINPRGFLPVTLPHGYFFMESSAGSSAEAERQNSIMYYVFIVYIYIHFLCNTFCIEAGFELKFGQTSSYTRKQFENVRPDQWDYVVTHNYQGECPFPLQYLVGHLGMFGTAAWGHWRYHHKQHIGADPQFSCHAVR